MPDHRLLFVDDEQGVLDSLERLFIDEDYQIETATGGKDALKKMRTTTFSLIISDQRMPEQTGAEFLEKAKELAPDTIRIMLTGYSDIQEAVSAINKGEVFRYINKPWDDDELKIVVKQGLRQYDLIAQNRELQALVREQNNALKDINKNLEERIQERTREIEEKNEELESNFISSIRVFAGLISQYDSFLGEHCKRVSIFSRRLAESKKFSEAQVLDIEIAGLLHDIGAISMSKRVFARDPGELSKNELAQMQRHPVLGQDCITPMNKLRDIGLIIRHHHESYDGSGYPDGLRGDEIPVASRLISVVDGYDLRANARGYYQNASPQVAMNYITRNSGTIYDPELINAFSNLLRDIKGGSSADLALPLSELEEGMKLSRNLLTRSGKLLMDKGSVIRAADLERLKNFNAADPIVDEIRVYRKAAN